MSSLIVNLMNELHDAMTRDDQKNIWSNPGNRELDSTIEVVADYYIQFPSQRDMIRCEIKEIDSLWSLVLFVRRAGLLMRTTAGEKWLRRGLAVASIVDANCDYRDLIVSLVILRSYAIDAGIETDSAFDAAIGWSTDRMHDILINARNHAASDIRVTLASFGPPDEFR